MIYTFVLLVKH